MLPLPRPWNLRWIWSYLCMDFIYVFVSGIVNPDANEKTRSVNRQSLIMSKFADWVIRRRQPLLVVMLGVTLTSTALLPRFNFDDRFVEYFDERMDFRVASDWAADNLSGIYIINYSLASDGPGGVSDPNYLEKLDEFSLWLRGQPEVNMLRASQTSSNA